MGDFASTAETRRWHKLSLQAKAWCIVGGTLALLAVVLGLGLTLVFNRSHAELEVQRVEEALARVRRALDAELDGLERTARDYANWTETYAFMADWTPTYEQTNLDAGSVENLRLDVFLFYRLDGTYHAGRSYNVTSSADRLAGEISGFVKPAAQAEGTRVKGLVRTSEGLLLLAAVPILQDGAVGPPRGVLVHGRILNQKVVRSIEEISGVDVRVESATLRTVDGERAITTPARALPTGFQIESWDDAHMRVAAPLLDVTHSVIAELKLLLPRHIHQQWIKTRRLFYAVLATVVLIAGALTAWLLRRSVLAPLRSLISDLERIEQTADPAVRLRTVHAHELGQLAQAINRTLAALERVRDDQARAQQEKDLLNARLQQSQKMEAVGTLAGGIAHDFNNLLYIISGSATLLRLELSDNPALVENLNRIDAASRQAADLVRQLLTFSRRSEPNFAREGLGDIVTEVLPLLRAALTRSVELRFSNAVKHDVVLADKNQLHQVIINLANNAGHAMGEGGVLTLRIDEVNLPDADYPETLALGFGRYLRLTVGDTGAGIRPELIARIFEPFFTTKPPGSGTGLGLSVAHGIVSQHGGTIGVKSLVGKGTTFAIHLPVALARPSEASTGPSGRRMDGSPIRVALVDDDRLVRQTLAAGLMKQGFLVESCADPLSAQQKISTEGERIDVIITDQAMPGMTGLELAGALRSRGTRIPIILLSGYADTLDPAAARRAGVDRLLRKPIELIDLAREVQALADGALKGG